MQGPDKKKPTQYLIHIKHPVQKSKTIIYFHLKRHSFSASGKNPPSAFIKAFTHFRDSFF